MKLKKRNWLFCLTFLLLAFSSVAQVTEIKGLTVLVEFADAPFPESTDSVALMMNQTGFSGWGNEGSVKDFYLTQSAGKVAVTSTVIKVSLNHTKGYYYVQKLGKDLSDIIDAINLQYPQGFQNLSINPTDNSLLNFTILTKAGGGAWAFGPQPGSNKIKNNGLDVFVYTGNITNYDLGQKPEHSTICHEMGHNIMHWPDHYNTAWSNLGNYCIMGTGGNIKAPQAVNPALRMQKGWINNVIEIGHASQSQTITATSNSYNTVYKYTNPANPKEYLLIHPQVYGKYYQEKIHNYGVADQGLAIYYVDEDGGMDLPGEEADYFIKLLQADNKNELSDESLTGAIELTPGSGYTKISGDYDDLYDNVKNSFPNGTPFRWKDGGEFGLFLSQISAPGATMTFTVLPRSNTFIALSDKNGTISPKGVISSTNQTFTMLPNPGYEINTLKVNGVSVTALNNQYTLTGTGSTKTIEVSFKRKSTQTPLTAPWTKTDLGTHSATGFAADNSGKFHLESFANKLDDLSDNCTFVNQQLNGDGTIIAHIAEYNKPTRRINKIGIMIRASLQANAAQSLIARIPYSGVTVEQRTASGNFTVTDPNGIGNLHRFELYNWLKITRKGNEITSYCSRDGVDWRPLGHQFINLPTQIYAGVFVTGAKGTYAARAIFDNVSVIQGTTACSFTGTEIIGTSIGTTGSYNNSGSTREKAFDNNIFTYFDASESVAWSGLDLNSNHKITGIRYFPREGFTYRMIGGKFQGSNTADFSSGVTDLATILVEPLYDWNCIPVSNTSAFRYIRYISPVDGVGNVAEVEFYGSPAITNTPPTVTITSPANGTNFNAPASISITANASDVGGSITKVEFYNGTTFLGTDLTAPYTWNWTNVAAGTYNIIAKATDNEGTSSSHTVTGIKVNPATGDIIGASCGNNNVVLQYELSAAKRVNANGYSWWYTGTAQSIQPVPGTAHKANLSTGNNFTAGQICVGVNYSGSPHYAQFCKSVTKCSGTREDESGWSEEVSGISYQNPFIHSTIISIPVGTDNAEVKVYNASGVLLDQFNAMNSFEFGADLNGGLYVVRISYDGRTEILKLIKE